MNFHGIFLKEFNKLYVNCLEETFSRCNVPVTRNVLREQFRGKYSYSKTCCKCGTVSRQPSHFYELELNIKGFKSITESLNGNQIIIFFFNI